MIDKNELKKILEQWEPDYDVMRTEDDKSHYTKVAMSMLPDAERIIMALYLEYQASRKVGKLLGVSHSTILKEVRKIKEKIISNYEQILRTELPDGKEL